MVDPKDIHVFRRPLDDLEGKRKMKKFSNVEDDNSFHYSKLSKKSKYFPQAIFNTLTEPKKYLIRKL